MDMQQQIDMWVMQNNENFAPIQLSQIKDKMQTLDENKISSLMGLELKKPTMMMIISFFLGGLGVDRIMLGQTGLGIVKLLVCVGIYAVGWLLLFIPYIVPLVWWLVDVINVKKQTKNNNYKKVMAHFVMM
jgi:TM2 domain-containing membrane protein YozV